GDAASFVASDGSIRGARLEAALRWLRVAHPELAASDQELAEAILAQ
ncbi:Holliday junction resolvase, partial [Pseudomonas aeruginosa]